MDDHHLNTKDTVKLVVELIDEHSLLMDIKNAGLHDILTMVRPKKRV